MPSLAARCSAADADDGFPAVRGAQKFGGRTSEYPPGLRLAARLQLSRVTRSPGSLLTFALELIAGGVKVCLRYDGTPPPAVLIT